MIFAGLCNWQHQPKVFPTVAKLRLVATSTVISHVYDKRTLAFWILPKFCCLVCLVGWSGCDVLLGVYCKWDTLLDAQIPSTWSRMCEVLRCRRWRSRSHSFWSVTLAWPILLHLSYLPIIWMNCNLMLNVTPFSSVAHCMLCVPGVPGFCNSYWFVLWRSW